MKSFNIESQTTPAENFAFAGNQQSRAESVSAVRVFNWRDIHGNVNGLPKYVLAAIRAAGYTAHCLGGTTYSHSVIGLAITTPDDERRALRTAYWGVANIKWLRERLAMAVALFPELRSEFAPRLVALEMEAAK